MNLMRITKLSIHLAGPSKPAVHSPPIISYFKKSWLFASLLVKIRSLSLIKSNYRQGSTAKLFECITSNMEYVHFHIHCFRCRNSNHAKAERLKP
jgi:hypothetical protein